MSDRDELVETIRQELAGGGYQMPSDKLPYQGQAKVIAFSLTAAGYRKPQYLSDDELYTVNGFTDLPDDTFVQSVDGSVWRVEPEFGWTCVSEGSAVLGGPARLLVLGDQ